MELLLPEECTRPPSSMVSVCSQRWRHLKMRGTASYTCRMCELKDGNGKWVCVWGGESILIEGKTDWLFAWLLNEEGNSVAGSGLRGRGGGGRRVQSMYARDIRAGSQLVAL